VIATVLVDTNVFTARLWERSPLATSYAKHLFGQRIAVAPQTVAEARYGRSAPAGAQPDWSDSRG
jgi:hypothetical protein